MSILVQKFGGTSLATPECRNQVIDKIIEAKKKYDRVIVVVSAMGRLGLPYATDTLLSLVNLDQQYLADREVDLLLSCGEIISAVILSNLLQMKGLKSYAITGGEAGVITNDTFRNAEVIRLEPDTLNRLLKADYIPVVTGFQGKTMQQDITTLGRGGSDTSAVLIGEALHADAVEIYTDVDGIMTADPRVCPKAQIIHNLSYGEVFQMADSGAKVIHSKAVEVARRSGIPVIIKNTFNNSPGTCITAYNQLMNKKEQKLITTIAHRSERLQVVIEGKINDKQFFEDLATNKISIDIINVFPKKRVFTINADKKKVMIGILKTYKATYSFIDHCCKVTVIGERMTGVPGVMAKIIKALSEVHVEILQTVDSLSTITCLIKEDDLEKTVTALHKAFELE